MPVPPTPPPPPPHIPKWAAYSETSVTQYLGTGEFNTNALALPRNKGEAVSWTGLRNTSSVYLGYGNHRAATWVKQNKSVVEVTPALIKAPSSDVLKVDPALRVVYFSSTDRANVHHGNLSLGIWLPKVINDWVGSWVTFHFDVCLFCADTRGEEWAYFNHGTPTTISVDYSELLQSGVDAIVNIFPVDTNGLQELISRRVISALSGRLLKQIPPGGFRLNYNIEFGTTSTLEDQQNRLWLAVNYAFSFTRGRTEVDFVDRSPKGDLSLTSHHDIDDWEIVSSEEPSLPD